MERILWILKVLWNLVWSTRSEAIADLRDKPQAPNATNAETTNAEKGGECGTKCGSIFELKSGLCEMSARSYLKGSAEARSEAIADFGQKDNAQKLKELKQSYQYFGVETCATCSMCSLLLPPRN